MDHPSSSFEVDDILTDWFYDRESQHIFGGSGHNDTQINAGRLVDLFKKDDDLYVLTTTGIYCLL